MRYFVLLSLIAGCGSSPDTNQSDAGNDLSASDLASADGPAARDGATDGPGPAATLSFGAAKPFAADVTPFGILVADFTRDGKLDIAVSNYGSADVSVLPGDGQGGFGQPKNTPVGMLPTSLATADFNNDGTPDLVVGDGQYTDSPPSNDVYGLLGNGDGTFTVTNYPQPSYAGDHVVCQAIATADFNKDTRPDAEVLCEGAQHNAGLNFFGDTSNGTFAAVVPGVGVVPSMGVHAMVVGDFNHDGNLDVVAFDKIMLGVGDGTFQASTPSGLFVVRGGVTADFDDNGTLDVVYSDSQQIFVAKGNGMGAFGTPSQITSGTSEIPWGMAMADFNTDGKLDVVVANNSGHSVTVLLGNGDATFQTAKDFAAGMTPTSVAVGDFNSDGRPDIAVADQNIVQVLLNDSH